MATAKKTLSVSNIVLIFSHDIYLVYHTLFQKIEKYINIYLIILTTQFLSY